MKIECWPRHDKQHQHSTTTPEGVVNLIMPQLRVKIKEVLMSLKKELLDLEITANQISRLINAVELMSTGLDLEDDPHAVGFFAVCG